MEKHWTQRSIKDYIFRIASDFISQLEDKIESEKMSQDDFANRLQKTKGRVSQILNKPGNMKLEKMVEYAQALGLKVSIVAYEDKGDPNNDKGPINSDIFRTCWEKTGAPRDFWAVAEIGKSTATPDNAAVKASAGQTGMSFNRSRVGYLAPILEATILARLFEEELPQEQAWEENYRFIGGIGSAVSLQNFPGERRGAQVTQLIPRKLNLQTDKEYRYETFIR